MGRRPVETPRLSECAITRMEAQWLLGATPSYLGVLERKAGLRGKRRGFKIDDFERLAMVSQASTDLKTDRRPVRAKRKTRK